MNFDLFTGHVPNAGLPANVCGDGIDTLLQDGSPSTTFPLSKPTPFSFGMCRMATSASAETPSEEEHTSVSTSFFPILLLMPLPLAASSWSLASPNIL